MLGKLMKYEWKATWKLLVPAYAWVVVSTVLTCIAIRTDEWSSGLLEQADVWSGMFMVLMIMLYGFSMMAAMAGGLIFLIYRFYTSVYGDQGYLLHTLPVDKHHIILSKLIVSFLWIVAGVALLYSSLIFLFQMEGDFAVTFREFLMWRQEMFLLYDEEKLSAFAVVMTVIAILVELLSKMLKVAAAISLGQLSANHKLLSSIGFYFAIHIVQNIIRTLFIVLLTVVMEAVDSEPGVVFSWSTTLISGLIYCVVFYLATWYIMEKKLNLE